MPEMIVSEKFFYQKLRYIEQNPVRKGYVTDPTHWRYSSAHPDMLIPIADPLDVVLAKQ